MGQHALMKSLPISYRHQRENDQNLMETTSWANQTDSNQLEALLDIVMTD